jgi:hypothetical protein
MKNIHLIPTDKPSRLSILNSGKLNFGAEIMSSSNSKSQHIYITSDEEIKEGDWCLDEENNRIFQFKYFNSGVLHSDNHSQFESKCKKIILTTDQDLIKDGVQSIDDEFLEWFVKNPSCEEVEIKKGKMRLNCDGEEIGFPNMSLYKIIIPKEEPKQETLEEITKIICHTHKTPIEQANEIIELLQQQMYSEEEVDKMISDFKHDLIESTSNYVKQNCEGAIFGLSRLKNSKKK